MIFLYMPLFLFRFQEIIAILNKQDNSNKMGCDLILVFGKVQIKHLTLKGYGSTASTSSDFLLKFFFLKNLIYGINGVIYPLPLNKFSVSNSVPTAPPSTQHQPEEPILYKPTWKPYNKHTQLHTQL